uniref:Uncharacterized protein n=1 Tax=Pygocentrus nattereri TaxID=42514 RepID=A0AAR2LDV9_PYGNA
MGQSAPQGVQCGNTNECRDASGSPEFSSLCKGQGTLEWDHPERLAQALESAWKPSMLALPIIVKQNSASIGLFTH